MSMEDPHSKGPSFSRKRPVQPKQKPERRTDDPADSPATLSHKMAAISSMRASTVEADKREKSSGKGISRMLSSLPDALARIDRKLTLSDSMVAGDGFHDDSTSASPSRSMTKPEPDPGSIRAIFWYLFRFGLYTLGPLKSQSRFVVIGMWIVLSLSISAQAMVWLGPGVVTSGSVYISKEFLLRLAGSTSAAFIIYVIIGMCFYWLADNDDKSGPITGVGIVVNACAPLMLVQTAYILVHHALLGESFWRGATLGGASPWNEWVFPVVWVWSGIRLAQAATALTSTGSGLRQMAPMILFFIPVLAGAGLHPAVAHIARQDVVKEWAVLREQFLAPDMTFDSERFARLERNLPFHADEARSELYLYRLQVRFREGDFDAALEDARRLERLFPSGSAMDFVAKGLTAFLAGRQDEARRLWSRAIEKDADCLPAHRWLALVSVGEDPEKAERHARFLMQKDPNVFHLFLLVRILESRDMPEDIWQAMLEVNAPPEKWYPLTLLHGGLAAQTLQKTKRAEQLLRLAAEKGLTPEEGRDSI